jgi:hypothetical protein
MQHRAQWTTCISLTHKTDGFELSKQQTTTVRETIITVSVHSVAGQT